MQSKIIRHLTTIFLCLLPFLLGSPLGKHTPYIETNPFWTYVIIWATSSLTVAAIAWLIARKFQRNMTNPYLPGYVLFLLLIPALGILGLAVAPDLSMTMLEHPEREHFRYALLFIALIPFFGFFRLINRPNYLELSTIARSVLVALFFIAFLVFLNEFSHHYSYPEALQRWVNEGKAFEDFSKNYDTRAGIAEGAIGRLAQYAFIIFLVIRLYQLRKVLLWAPIVLVFLSLLGMVSSVIMWVTEFHPPQGLEFLFLLFIPGMPFLFLYWLGIAWLTKFNPPATSV